MVLVYREKLQDKTVKELKAIYTRKFGKDLLRGTKAEMIHTLAMALDSRRKWQIISNPKNK